MTLSILSLYTFFFNYTATTEIYTLSLHDALPISRTARPMPDGVTPSEPVGLPSLRHRAPHASRRAVPARPRCAACRTARSEEHTSELQSLAYLVCRLLLEKKNRSISV